MQANCGVAALLLVGALSTLSACATAQQFDTSSSRPKRATAQSGAPKAVAAANDSARIRALAAKAAPNDPAEQERLLEEFMQWRKSQQKR